MHLFVVYSSHADSEVLATLIKMPAFIITKFTLSSSCSPPISIGLALNQIKISIHLLAEQVEFLYMFPAFVK